MALHQWTSLGNGWECKYTGTDDEGTIMYRVEGQASEYPHSTVFYKRGADGKLQFQDEHNSPAKKTHDFDLQRNLSFIIQNM